MEPEKILVGIRAEDKSFWERRTPVPPHDCEIIMKKVMIRSIFKSIRKFNSLCNHQLKESSLTNNTGK